MTSRSNHCVPNERESRATEPVPNSLGNIHPIASVEGHEAK